MLDLLALIPLGIVTKVYYKLSLETKTPGLRRSALGLFGFVIVLLLAELNIADDGPRWWNVLIWIVLALVTGLFLLIVWDLEEFEKISVEDSPDALAEQSPAAVSLAMEVNTVPEPASGQPNAGDTAKAVGAVIGVMVAVGLFVLKFVAKVVAGVRGVLAIGANGIEIIGQVILLTLTAAFLIWFAVAKIRLRRVLGPLAASAGSVELLVILLFGFALAGIFWEVFQIDQAGLNEQATEMKIKELDLIWMQRIEVGTIGAGGVWAAITAGLFFANQRIKR